MIRMLVGETDNRRKEIIWLILALLGAIGLTLFLVLYLGYELPVRSRDDAVILFGLVAILGCAIAYFAGKEKQQRQLNQSLVHSLQAAVREMNERVGRFEDLSRANSELGTSLGRLEKELDETYLRTLQVLMRTLDARDDYTALHGEQVTSVAAMIARRMGLRAELVDTIERFGPLHDIGQIGIPDHILHKTEPLTEEESALFRQHPAMGETIIQPLRPSPDAAAMLRSHHERWDGQGYPDRLAGTDIPLLARILGVADAYHAMTSRHPDRAAVDRTQAMREVLAGAGTQFDPDVVGVLGALEFEGKLNARGAQ